MVGKRPPQLVLSINLVARTRAVFLSGKAQRNVATEGTTTQQEVHIVAHRDIRIPFTIADRHYEAVGFLNEGEESVDADTMFVRTAMENGGAIGEEDDDYIWAHRDQIPTQLQGYWPATNRHNIPEQMPRHIRCYGFYDGRWDRGWYGPGNQWYDWNLVVRRIS